MCLESKLLTSHLHKCVINTNKHMFSKSVAFASKLLFLVANAQKITICNTANVLSCFQAEDREDDVEGFAGSDDTQPAVDSFHASSRELGRISTYGEDELVPEPHRVSVFIHGCLRCVTIEEIFTLE